jgi:hypothetical protein
MLIYVMTSNIRFIFLREEETDQNETTENSLDGQMEVDSLTARIFHQYKLVQPQIVDKEKQGPSLNDAVKQAADMLRNNSVVFAAHQLMKMRAEQDGNRFLGIPIDAPLSADIETQNAQASSGKDHNEQEKRKAGDPAVGVGDVKAKTLNNQSGKENKASFAQTDTVESKKIGSHHNLPSITSRTSKEQLTFVTQLGDDHFSLGAHIKNKQCIDDTGGKDALPQVHKHACRSSSMHGKKKNRRRYHATPSAQGDQYTETHCRKEREATFSLSNSHILGDSPRQHVSLAKTLDSRLHTEDSQESMKVLAPEGMSARTSLDGEDLSSFEEELSCASADEGRRANTHPQENDRARVKSGVSNSLCTEKTNYDASLQYSASSYPKTPRNSQCSNFSNYSKLSQPRKRKKSANLYSGGDGSDHFRFHQNTSQHIQQSDPTRDTATVGAINGSRTVSSENQSSAKRVHIPLQASSMRKVHTDDGKLKNVNKNNRVVTDDFSANCAASLVTNVSKPLTTKKVNYNSLTIDTEDSSTTSKSYSDSDSSFIDSSDECHGYKPQIQPKYQRPPLPATSILRPSTIKPMSVHDTT